VESYWVHFFSSNFAFFFVFFLSVLGSCAPAWLSHNVLWSHQPSTHLFNNPQFCTKQQQKSLFQSSQKPKITKERERETNLPTYHYFQKNLFFIQTQKPNSCEPKPQPHKSILEKTLKFLDISLSKKGLMMNRDRQKKYK